VEKCIIKIILNQFALTTVIILILTIGSAAASDNSHNSMYWDNKRVGITKLNKLDEVIGAYDKTIESNQSDSIGWNNKGNVLE